MAGLWAPVCLAAAVGAPDGAPGGRQFPQAFAACSVCHDTGQTNNRGPSLLGIVGRQAGRAEGFRYSRAMKSARIVWNEKTLEAYLSDPQGFIPGNAMPFPGVPDPRQRAELIAFLKTLK